MPKGNKWEDIRDDLFQAYIYAAGPITTDMQASIEEFMQSRGHEIRWNAISLTKWDHKTHEDILLAMVEHFRPAVPDCKEITKILRSKGYTFTDSALLYVEMKLRTFTCRFEDDDVYYVVKASRPTIWDHDAHLALLQAVMIEAHPTKPQWEKILKRVHTKGYNYTQAAVLSHMKWDHNADKALIGCMMDENNPSEQNYRNLTAHMHKLGYTCTVKAVKQHLQKLRRKEGVAAATAGASDGGSVATPAKGRKRSAPGSGVKKTPGTGRGKKAAAAKSVPIAIDDSDDEEAGDFKETPSKKMKTEPKPDLESKVKEEFEEGAEDYMYPNEI
ncbi:hypothetical protein B0T20DRAFT_456081 [Sordaria brevicollis]|uniref:Uncharacterized protein n=1 Tax=Sordaria brevicollis TaxID=83679 RepID=A0AAE0P3H8_SORBR|nr:hypothetical protein B0T20DRAFT_456081 [Sordaria brevicollis]